MKKVSIIGIILVIIIIVIAIAAIFYFGLIEIPEEPYELVCGDGYCDQDYETYETCPDDCIAPACNNDDICDPWETSDCPDCQTDLCGNGIIDNGETCQTCPDDAGECQDDITSGTGFRRPLVPVQLGDTFWITVYLVPNTGETIGTFIMDMSYDASKLEYISMSPQGDWTTFWYENFGTNANTLTDVQSFDIDGQSTKADLFRIRFKAIGTGSAGLVFDNLDCTNELAESIIVTTTDNYIDIIE